MREPIELKPKPKFKHTVEGEQERTEGGREGGKGAGKEKERESEGEERERGGGLTRRRTDGRNHL